MKTAHLIYGPVAAGKSTYALRLASERNAIRFTLDDWMHTLFGPDVGTGIDMAWAMDRVARCRAVIWSIAAQTLASGRDVVLEIGAMRVEERSQLRSQVEAAGHQAEFHFIDAGLATRRQRVLNRNAAKGGTYSFEVTPGMFEAMERVFERPTEQELGQGAMRAASHHE